MKIHSSPWKTLPIRSAVFAVLVSLAVHAQAQQNSVEERQEKNRIDPSGPRINYTNCSELRSSAGKTSIPSSSTS